MHVCLFDIDGTLIHTRGAGMAALREGLRAAFGITEPTDQVAVHGRTDRGFTRDLFRHHGIENLPEHWERF
ncbi:MAG: HAD family hydrolase, partial [Deltaproteobacteria bacterium]